MFLRKHKKEFFSKTMNGMRQKTNLISKHINKILSFGMKQPDNVNQAERGICIVKNEEKKKQLYDLLPIVYSLSTQEQPSKQTNKQSSRSPSVSSCDGHQVFF
jgi:hypothetical protein